MKSPLLRFAFITAVIVGVPAIRAVSPPEDPLVVFGADPGAGRVLFRLGTPSATIARILGEPDVRLASNVWIYWNYRSDRPEASAQGLDTLVIGFSDEKVYAMKLVPHQSLEPYLVRNATNPAFPSVAKK